MSAKGRRLVLSVLPRGQEKTKAGEVGQCDSIKRTVHQAIHVLAHSARTRTFCAQVHYRIRFLALICSPTRLGHIVTVNVPTLYLYYRAEDSDVVEATLYGGVPHLISALAPMHCAEGESLSRGMRPWRA